MTIIQRTRPNGDYDSPVDAGTATSKPPGEDPHGVTVVPCAICGEHSSVLTASGPYCSPHAVANIHNTLTIANRTIGKVTP